MIFELVRNELVKRQAKLLEKKGGRRLSWRRGSLYMFPK